MLILVLVINIKKILVSLCVVILIFLFTITGTYAIIIDVMEKDGITEMVNKISIRDLFIDSSNNYNSIYYDVLNELSITTLDAEFIMNDSSLNEGLQIVLDNVVKYNLYNESKLSDMELYNLIVEKTNNSGLSDVLKEKVIRKSYYYIDDILDYLYDTPVNLIR